ncbi:MAG: hypothetical protein U0350_34810 [Caldilineaceae bacterium]
MQPQKLNKKLILARETLRDLTNQELGLVAAGAKPTKQCQPLTIEPNCQINPPPAPTDPVGPGSQVNCIFSIHICN